MTDPNPREWTLKYIAGVFNADGRGSILPPEVIIENGPNLQVGETVKVIEYSAYQALEQRLAECEIELERVRDVCASLNREKNSTFDQSCKNFERVKDLEAEVEKLEIVRIEWATEHPVYSLSKQLEAELNVALDELTSERKVTQVLEAALEFYADEDRILNFNPPEFRRPAREALAEAAKVREGSK